ncbi:MAG: T9SS type A sorting domain-containing protein [Bacteroidales bacterium]|nr:T9SS type A sorting domain-containing protein [Bacteroidales bacterium]
MNQIFRNAAIVLGLSLLSFSLSAQDGPQLDNSGFEQWTSRSENAVSEPVHWHSGGTATGSFSGFVSSQIEQSTHTRPGSSGSKSVRLYPSSVLGITANGNLTNGRMNAGSMSATGSGNYNYTQRSNSAFNTPITSVPDSLVVWVCFRSQSSTDKAQIHAVIHGDADYKLIADGTEEPANMKVASALLSFTRTSTANGAYTWQRLSIPFVKNGPCTDPRYILFTATTNETPGHGSTNDDLFIDDISLIYNPTATMEMAASCSLYPNPFTSTLSISTEKTAKNIQIYDVYGRLIMEQAASTRQLDLDLSALNAGVYLLQLDYGDGKSVHRILKASY